MKFSVEVPIKYLKELDECQDYLFIIGHHLLDSPEYLKYCKESKKYKILDNSCYELGESIEPKILKKLAIDIKADVIVLPDKLFDSKRSEELQSEFFKLFTNIERFNYKFLKVISANNTKEYIDNLIKANNDPNVNIIGISRSRTMIAPNLSYVMNRLKDKCKNIKDIHLLGCSHPMELSEAYYFKEIKSIDSGLATNFAFVNEELPFSTRSDEFKRISGKDLDTLDDLDINLTKKNIETFKRYYYDISK